MFTSACQCCRANRDKHSPRGQELSAPWTVDAASVLREAVHTNSSSGTAGTNSLKCASNSAGEKDRRSCCWDERIKFWEIETLLKSRT